MQQSGDLSLPAALLGSASRFVVLADLHILLLVMYQSNTISLRNRPFHCPHFCVDYLSCYMLRSDLEPQCI